LALSDFASLSLTASWQARKNLSIRKTSFLFPWWRYANKAIIGSSNDQG
jgi:hypothetical protein